MKLWINAVATNGVRIVTTDENNKEITYKYISTKDLSVVEATKQAKSIAKSVNGRVVEDMVVLTTIDELRELGSLKVPASSFSSIPAKGQLYNAEAADVYYETDDAGERTSAYLQAENLTIGEQEELTSKKTERVSLL